MRVNSLQGQTVSGPVFRILVLAVVSAAEDAALDALGRQSSDVFRKFRVVCRHQAGVPRRRHDFHGLAHPLRHSKSLLAPMFYVGAGIPAACCSRGSEKRPGNSRSGCQPCTCPDNQDNTNVFLQRTYLQSQHASACLRCLPDISAYLEICASKFRLS